MEKFRDSLEVFLRQSMGRAEGLTIWRDPALQGNDEFAETIRTAVRSSAVMISILSPSYIQSRWCKDEVGLFCDATSDTVKIDRKSRVFKVLLSNVDLEQQPAPLQGLLGYPFFERDRETGRETRFRRTKEEDADQRYWEKLDDLAKAIASLLESLKNEQKQAKDIQLAPQQETLASSSSPPSVSASTSTTVYLAEVTGDVDDYRDQLRRTLTQHGIQVLPAAPLSPQSPDFADTVRQALRASVLSVHMLGQYYGKKVDDERSLPHLQCDVAAEIARETSDASPEQAFSRLIWTPRELDLTALNPTQHSLLESLESTSDPLVPTEMLQVGIEELKDLILARALPPEPALPEVLEDPLVCIACAREDSASAKLIKDYLVEQQKVDVIVASSDSTEEELSRRIRKNIQHCDALLIFYGQVSPNWVEETASTARKLMKSRADRALMCIYDGPPTEKEEIEMYFQNLFIIKSREPFRADSMRDFLRSLGRRL